MSCWCSLASFHSQGVRAFTRSNHDTNRGRRRPRRSCGTRHSTKFIRRRIADGSLPPFGSRVRASSASIAPTLSRSRQPVGGAV